MYVYYIHVYISIWQSLWQELVVIVIVVLLRLWVTVSVWGDEGFCCIIDCTHTHTYNFEPLLTLALN